TKRLLYARISSIMAFITCYCFLLTKIKKLYGSLQALHRKIVPLGNHFRRECTTMAKEKTVYVCSNCGQDSPKWVGKCPSCGMWNTYVEEVVRKEVVNKRPVSGIETAKAKPITLHEIVADDEPRIDLHDAELNRVLGGGLVQGSLVLIGGEPGIGKSTLVLQ